MMHHSQVAPIRAGLLGVLDHAADGKGRLERAILAAVGSGVGLILLGWVLGRRP